MGDLYVGPWEQPRPKPKPSCFTCLNAMFGPRGTYCSLYAETIFDEYAECEGFEENERGPQDPHRAGLT